MRTKSIKSEVTRFFINRYTRNLSVIFMLLPCLFLVLKQEESTYRIFYYVITLVILSVLVNGRNIKANGETYRKRYKYRYIILACYVFFSNLLCCLMDYYFYGSDYLPTIMEATIFYSVISIPFIAVRTHYSRAIDLLDYHCEEMHPYLFLIAVIISFYLIMFCFIYVVNLLNLGYIFWSGEDDASGMIFITMIEYFLYVLIYWMYVRKREKDKNPIWY